MNSKKQSDTKTCELSLPAEILLLIAKRSLFLAVLLAGAYFFQPAQYQRILDAKYDAELGIKKLEALAEIWPYLDRADQRSAEAQLMAISIRSSKANESEKIRMMNERFIPVAFDAIDMIGLAYKAADKRRFWIGERLHGQVFDYADDQITCIKTFLLGDSSGYDKARRQLAERRRAVLAELGIDEELREP